MTPTYTQIKELTMPADQELEIETPPTSDVVEAPAEATPADTTEATPVEPKTYTSWQEALKDADPEELLKHDAIAGRIGQVADKRARELAAQSAAADKAQRQVEADRAETQRLRELRSENPMAYANEMERRDASADVIANETRRQMAMTADVQGELQSYVTANFPRGVVESLAGKTYEGTYAQGITAYMADIHKAAQSAQRAAWERDELPKIRKQILTELNGGEPSIDSSAGGSRAGKKFNSNLEASTALMAGQIDITEYTRQSRQNGWR